MIRATVHSTQYDLTRPLVVRYGYDTGQSPTARRLDDIKNLLRIIRGRRRRSYAVPIQ